MRAREYDCVVVGLGALGSAAAYWLARSGLSVAGFERFEFGHKRGASHDHSRIIRRSYHTPGYVRLAGEAYDAWEEVERESGERLVFRTGGLDFGPRGAVDGEMEQNAASMGAEGVAFERLDASEIMRRWPMWQLPESVAGLFQPDAGIIAAARSGDALRRLAAARGAMLRERAHVESLVDRGGEIEVTVAGDVVRAGAAVVCADAWTNEVLQGLEVELPLRVTQEQVVYFNAPRPVDLTPTRFPVWIWLDEPGFYGVPTFGEPGVKVGQDIGGRDVAAETRTFDVDQGALARVADFVGDHLVAAGAPRAVKTCLYTLTPDRDFVLDSVPGHPRAWVGLGAAHGFKFAAVLGRILAELVARGRTSSAIDAFRFDRAALSGQPAC